MLKEIPIGNLRPNPFRRLDEYPILREKVDTLKRSFETIGFWESIIARPADDGCYEIAFGHHRLVALHETFKPHDAVPIIVRKLSNEEMLRMMALENLEEWGSSGWAIIETVRATIDAYHRGEIEFSPLSPAANKLPKLPVLKADQPVDPPALSVARFLGWTRKKESNRLQPDHKCQVAFRAIDAMKKGWVKAAQLKRLSLGAIDELVQSQVAIQETGKRLADSNRNDAERLRRLAQEEADAAERRRIERDAATLLHQAEYHDAHTRSKIETIADEAAKLAAEGGIRAVRQKGEELRYAQPEQPTRVDLDQYAKRIVTKLDNFLNGDDDLSGDIDFVRSHIKDLTAKTAEELCIASAGLRARLTARIEDVFDVS